MDIIHEDRDFQYQSLVLTPQKRTLKFNNQPKLVEIPKSIVVTFYYKEKHITGGYICDFELNYYINFGNDFCPKGQTFSNINEYVSWYWNSGFKYKCGKHTSINYDVLMACNIAHIGGHPFYLSFYSFIKFYQPNKLELWKSKNQEHLRCCDNCRNKLI